MRLITLVLGLAVLLWVIYTYQGANTVIKADGDKMVKQQAAEHVDEAKEAVSALQKSIDEQAKLIQKSNK